MDIFSYTWNGHCSVESVPSLCLFYLLTITQISSIFVRTLTFLLSQRSGFPLTFLQFQGKPTFSLFSFHFFTDVSLPKAGSEAKPQASTRQAEKQILPLIFSDTTLFYEVLSFSIFHLFV